MIAIDTNVFIYSIDVGEPVKRPKARNLLKQLYSADERALLLWQVAGELTRQLHAWRLQKEISQNELVTYLRTFRRLFTVAMPTPAVLDQAVELAARYSLSHWDSMLLAACLEAKVDKLFTEDMGSPTTIAGIQLLNPFV